MAEAWVLLHPLHLYIFPPDGKLILIGNNLTPPDVGDFGSEVVEVSAVELDGVVEGVEVGGQQMGTVALHFATCPSLDGGVALLPAISASSKG